MRLKFTEKLVEVCRHCEMCLSLGKTRDCASYYFTTLGGSFPRGYGVYWNSTLRGKVSNL